MTPPRELATLRELQGKVGHLAIRRRDTGSACSHLRALLANSGSQDTAPVLRAALDMLEAKEDILAQRQHLAELALETVKKEGA